MDILYIDQIEYDSKDDIYVTAYIEDAILSYPATYTDPPEYAPALCKASFSLEEDELLPQNENEWIKLLEELNLDWEVIKEENDY